MKRFRPYVVIDNTQTVIQPLPAVTKMARRLERHALVEAFEKGNNVVIAIKGPLLPEKVEALYESFFEATGNASAIVLWDRVEIKMPKSVYVQSFTPAA